MKEKKMRYKHLGIICPKCFNIQYTKVSIEPDDCETCDDWINFGKQISIEAGFMFTCSNCRRNVLAITVDANIAEAIALLNKKGYKTKYSCGGDNCLPYIVFDESMTRYFSIIKDSAIQDRERLILQPNDQYGRISITWFTSVCDWGTDTINVKEVSDAFLQFAKRLPQFKEKATYPEMTEYF